MPYVNCTATSISIRFRLVLARPICVFVRGRGFTHTQGIRRSYAQCVTLFNVSRRLVLGAYCVVNGGIPAHSGGILDGSRTNYTMSIHSHLIFPQSSSAIASIFVTKSDPMFNFNLGTCNGFVGRIVAGAPSCQAASHGAAPPPGLSVRRAGAAPVVARAILSSGACTRVATWVLLV